MAEISPDIAEFIRRELEWRAESEYMGGYGWLEIRRHRETGAYLVFQKATGQLIRTFTNYPQAYEWARLEVEKVVRELEPIVEELPPPRPPPLIPPIPKRIEMAAKALRMPTFLIRGIRLRVPRGTLMPFPLPPKWRLVWRF